MKLQEWRESVKGWSRQYLANMLKVKRMQIYRWEEGEAIPSEKNMVKIRVLTQSMVKPGDFYF